jgi:hypothetical protein
MAQIHINPENQTPETIHLTVDFNDGDFVFMILKM